MKIKHLELLVFPANGRQLSFYEDCMSSKTTTFFLKFISMERASMIRCFIFRILQDISSLIIKSKPPPNLFLSSLNGSEYPVTKIANLGKT